MEDLCYSKAGGTSLGTISGNLIAEIGRVAWSNSF